jgi:hypothetical protein
MMGMAGIVRRSGMAPAAALFRLLLLFRLLIPAGYMIAPDDSGRPALALCSGVGAAVERGQGHGHDGHPAAPAPSKPSALPCPFAALAPPPLPPAPPVLPPPAPAVAAPQAALPLDILSRPALAAPPPPATGPPIPA